MKILEVSLPTRPVFPESMMSYLVEKNIVQSGAIEILIYLLVRGFRELGHEAYLYSTGGPPQQEGDYWNLLWDGGFNIERRNWHGFNKLLVESIALSPIKYDVVHVHAFATAVAPHLRDVPCPVYYTWHDPPTYTVGQSKRPQIEQVLKSKHIKPIAISYFQRDKLNLDIPVVHNGLDLEQYDWKRKRTDRYLSVGRMVPSKGFDIGVDACYRTGAKLDIIGNLYHKNYFKHSIQPRLNSAIKYHGAVYGKEKKEFFETCKGLLNPIRWEEPFGLTLVEVMASGAPIIGFDKGAVGEVAGDCGVFVNTAPELREVLTSNINIKASKCRKRAEIFNYKEMCRKYIRIFKRG